MPDNKSSNGQLSMLRLFLCLLCLCVVGVWIVVEYLQPMSMEKNSYNESLHRRIQPKYAPSYRYRLKEESIAGGNSSMDTDEIESNHTDVFTDPNSCTFSIENQQKTYNLCDKIRVIIQARDQFKQDKQIGGDYFRAKIFNEKLKASAATDGEIVDHNNGSYSAYFTLRWSGSVFVNVKLIHRSEAITAMDRVRKLKPVRMVFDGTFKLGKLQSIARCHVELSPAKELCNYTDNRTGEPWFCEKPKNFPCSAYTFHRGNTKLGGRETAVAFKPGDNKLFSHSKLTIGTKAIHVNISDEKTFCIESTAECQPNKNSARVERKLAAGFYFNDSWYSNDCALKNINVQSALSSKCLTNKKFYFYGDSTIRQWYEYFVANVKDANSKPASSGATWSTGPLQASSTKHNLTFFYRHHAFPIRTKPMLVEHVKYAANEINGISADENTVIFLCFFAHFEATSTEVYLSRLQTIKKALQRLYKRSPKTLVFIKSANTRSYGGPAGAVNMGDWAALQYDKEMRKLMAGLPNLTIIDVWDMTTNHRLGDNIHPREPIIKEFIKIALSFICG